MAKVIVERPRSRGWTKRGMRKGYRRAAHRALSGDDADFIREGITVRGGGDKHFSEHLGPLRRYLQAQTGRPWFAVFSEISRHIDRGNLVQRHILTHLFHYVETNAILIDRVPYYPPHLCYRGPRPIEGRNCWYVCPRSGLLRSAPLRVKRRGRNKDFCKARRPYDERMKHSRVAGIELGGTKIVLGVGDENGKLRIRHSMSTCATPAAVIAEILAWLHDQSEHFGPLACIGVASFGPVDLDPQSPTYGFITSTPKPGWSQIDLLTPLQQVFPNVPIGFNTDVNGAALAEHRWGAARGLDDFVYLTMGTGIGGGGMSGGRLLHGLRHPEMGHLSVPRQPGDTFHGTCPFHGDCWEGLCSGPAIKARTGVAAEDLPTDHPVWSSIIDITATAILSIAAVLSPGKVILGGSVRKAGRLGEDAFFERLREEIANQNAYYLPLPRDWLVPPALGDDAGVRGAIALGIKAAREEASDSERALAKR